MELGLFELAGLAATHLLAAKAGSWALGGHSKGSSRTHGLRHAHQGDTSLSSSRQNRQGRLTGRALRAPGHGGDRPADPAPLPFASASAGATSVQLGLQTGPAAPSAWMPTGRAWAARRTRRPEQRQRSTESVSQSTREDANSAGPTGRSPWGVPREHDAQRELLVGWHLEDEPVQDQQPSGGEPSGVASMAAAVSAAASRVFGGGDGGSGDPGADGTDATTGLDGGATAARQGGSTPHLVGSHALGADGAGGSGGAAGLGPGSSAVGSRPAAAAAVAAAALTSAGGAIGGLAERAVDAPVRGLRELNRAVTASVSDFLASDSGRRLSEHVAAEMSTGALMAPVYLTEELVKARLKSLLRSHAHWLATFLAVRVSVATALLHCTKELLKRAFRKRGPRWLRGAVTFLCDVALPTGFFGPLLGVTAGVLQLTGVSVTGLLLHRGGGGGGGGGGGSATDLLHLPAQPPLAAALPAVAAAAGDAVAATVAATVSPVASAAVSALSGGGSGE